MNKQITIIVGAQWGDEGKGKVTDFFARDANFVVRTQGGNNAGHTLVVNNEIYKLHLLPSGILYPGVTSIIGTGVLIDPGVLLNEINNIEKRGIELRLLISERAHVIMPYHIPMDEGITIMQGGLAAGSTKRGIAPVCADKMYRHGIRMIDLLEPELFLEKLEKAYNFNASIIKDVFHLSFTETIDEIYEKYVAYGEKLKKYVTDTELVLHQALKEGKKIVYEGAQGMSLDPDHGMYPHTTSTNTIAPYVGVGSGLGYNAEAKIIGVMKAYVSRVGTSPFITELEETEAKILRDKGNEYGTTTGRPRRVGWLDLVQVRQAVRVNGLTDIAITKLDILSGYEEIKICNSYDIQGVQVSEMPASLSKIRLAKPTYTTLPGWSATSNEEILYMLERGFDALPENLKNYIDFIEKHVGCRVSIISVGPKREETILR